MWETRQGSRSSCYPTLKALGLLGLFSLILSSVSDSHSTPALISHCSATQPVLAQPPRRAPSSHRPQLKNWQRQALVLLSVMNFIRSTEGPQPSLNPLLRYCLAKAFLWDFLRHLPSLFPFWPHIDSSSVFFLSSCFHCFFPVFFLLFGFFVCLFVCFFLFQVLLSYSLLHGSLNALAYMVCVIPFLLISWSPLNRHCHCL